MKLRSCLVLSLIAGGLVLVGVLEAADWPQFRGPDRTGVSKETGLLKSWPKEGPKLLWTYKNAGIGFSSYVIVGERLYTMGAFDDHEYVLALDLSKQGAELWRVKVGPTFSYGKWGDGPRSTPTVDGDRLYALGGHGDLVCLDTAKGTEIWRKSFVKDLDGQMMSEWGYSESPLVDGKQLICTPGGDKGTLAALDKMKGTVLWRSAEQKHKAPYSSVVVHRVGGIRTYVQTSYTEDHGFVSGYAATDGKVLWSETMFKRHSYAIAPTPIVRDNLVYVTSGYGGGCHLFEVSVAIGKLSAKAKELYSKRNQKTMINTHGGVVLIGDSIFGHHEDRGWICQDFKTGDERWAEKNQLECDSGAITAADGRLYLFSDTGVAVLLAPDTKEWQETGRVEIPEKSPLRAKLPNLRSAAVWTHPVVANGRLYLRDQELIFCYDVSEKK